MSEWNDDDLEEEEGEPKWEDDDFYEEKEDTKPLGPFAGCPRCGVLNSMTAKECWYCGEKLQ